MIHFSHPAGTIIQASDRQYRVSEDGSWRRLAKHEEAKGIVLKPEIPFHMDGRDTRTGAFCWCFECIRTYHPKVEGLNKNE